MKLESSRRAFLGTTAALGTGGLAALSSAASAQDAVKPDTGNPGDGGFGQSGRREVSSWERSGRPFSVQRTLTNTSRPDAKRRPQMPRSTVNWLSSAARSPGDARDPPLVARKPWIRRLDEDNAREGFLEDEQYRAILRELPQHLQALLVVGYHIGVRLGTLRKLEWD